MKDGMISWNQHASYIPPSTGKVPTSLTEFTKLGDSLTFGAASEDLNEPVAF